jgi:hypothetical protein
MAEILGVPSSGITASQPAGKIIVCTWTLYTFWTSLKGASKQVGDVLIEIELLGRVISNVKMRDDTEDDAALVALDSLRHCKGVMGILGALVGGLRLGHGQRELGETVGWFWGGVERAGTMCDDEQSREDGEDTGPGR